MLNSQPDAQLRSYFPLGFPLSKEAWERFGLGEVIGPEDFDKAGKMATLRLAADRISLHGLHGPLAAQTVKAGPLMTMGILADALRYLCYQYFFESEKTVLSEALEKLSREKGGDLVEQPPKSFVPLFPPAPVLQKPSEEATWLPSGGEKRRMEVVVELILLALFRDNPACLPYGELFDDEALQKKAPYKQFVEALEESLESAPPFSQLNMPLFQCLRAPIRSCPDSLEGQIAFIRAHWGGFLPAEMLEKLYLAGDVLREENLMRGFGPGPTQVLEFSSEILRPEDDFYPEPAAFTQDADWMSNVVLMAKCVYVWMDQLSRFYDRPIRTLSEIPDEELDRLARWGFTGLWLIGVWERSPASQRIKQIMGNPEAAPSAYSLYDYVIAQDLGGEEAYRNLKDRAGQRGIRLASDMVPNHTGIYSKWVIEHPDWFVQLPHSPYPCYSFTGEDLSHDGRVCLQIEDGYWEKRDAAVVFKRIDKETGDTRYIYHGNDGTNMPWNDTAQLNYLMPEVREAVIQTILHVARQFPIIRFDAAMTLAKKHYQRLWFPRHGDGGAIPSRAEQGLSRPEFDELFPKEFWREVVDRVLQEVPETLLLAEAFWLMEGYFVRTLGMHRVYNSAFMNMLKLEENSKYRMTVKNVLEFSPEVLKRFVNFMNNPDEETAVEQFGKDDKYFGVCLMMSTMPGLPMFGHGQIEGFAEKYGMEYRRAYWEENIDEHLVRRHQAEIFPLLRRRYLFSGAEHFAFYDFNTPEGWVNENVFAYSNRFGEERAVVLYNNAYASTKGWVHNSTAINVGGTEGDAHLVRKNIVEALELNTDSDVLYIFRDFRDRLDYLRWGRQIAEEGLFAELHGYQYHVFLDFREVRDSDGSWAELARQLQGTGVPSMEDAHKELRLRPLLEPFEACLNSKALKNLMAEKTPKTADFLENYGAFLKAAVEWDDRSKPSISCESIEKSLKSELELLPLKKAVEAIPFSDKGQKKAQAQLSDGAAFPGHVLPAWMALRHLGPFATPAKPGSKDQTQTAAARVAEDWLLGHVVERAFMAYCENRENALADSRLTLCLLNWEEALVSADVSLEKRFRQMLTDGPLREYLNVNLHEGVLWISKERLEIFARGLMLTALLPLTADGEATEKVADKLLQQVCLLIESAEKGGYQVEKMAQLLLDEKPTEKA